MKKRITWNIQQKKNYETLYKCTKIKNCLETVPFILFFFYDHLDPQNRALLRKQIAAKNLESFTLSNKIVKLTLSNPIYEKLKNSLIGNTLVVYHKNNEIIEKKIIMDLINNSKLELNLAIWNKEIYRNIDIVKYVKIIDKKPEIFVNLKNQIAHLQQLLFLLKQKIN